MRSPNTHAKCTRKSKNIFFVQRAQGFGKSFILQWNQSKNNEIFVVFALFDHYFEFPKKTIFYNDS